jgi:hypothetical protein
MVLEVCSYDECAINIINIEDLQAPIDFLFFLLSIILQQKRIEIKHIRQEKECNTFRFHIQIDIPLLIAK